MKWVAPTQKLKLKKSQIIGFCVLGNLAAWMEVVLFGLNLKDRTQRLSLKTIDSKRPWHKLIEWLTVQASDRNIGDSRTVGRHLTLNGRVDHITSFLLSKVCMVPIDRRTFHTHDTNTQSWCNALTVGAEQHFNTSNEGTSARRGRGRPLVLL